ncbi:hypothetical protein LJR129_004967 [Acidovorax sp. LjRoot129]|uniref:hypothetical protein n=1 Tax=unclassified Acidovorax TaxID=2684926 RepID=UPI003ED0DEAB
MYMSNEFSESGFLVARANTKSAQVQLILHGRGFVKEHHPVVVLIYAVFASCFSAWLAFELKDGNFSSPMAPLVGILSIVCFAMFWANATSLAKPVKGMEALLVSDFEFADEARHLIAVRKKANLPVRGIDLWRALVVHLRISGYR